MKIVCTKLVYAQSKAKCVNTLLLILTEEYFDINMQIMVCSMLIHYIYTGNSSIVATIGE